MGIKAFTDGVRVLLTGDATFQVALQSVIGQAVINVLRSNTPWAEIQAQQLPCFVIEQGDGAEGSNSNNEDAGEVIGNDQQQFHNELQIALLWNERDRDTAADARAQLPDLFAQLFMRNPQPGGCDGAKLTGWSPDQGIRHPRQTFVAFVRGETTIETAP